MTTIGCTFLVSFFAMIAVVQEKVVPSKIVDEKVKQVAFIEATDASFDELVKKEGETVIVDFYAPWCGPCRTQSAILERVASKVKAKIIKVNIDDNPRLSRQLNVSRIPTLMVFRDGKVQKTHVGVADESSVKELAAAK